MKSVDVMLEKDPGSPKLHCLHIIVIVEADMNMIMKVIWARTLVPHAEKHKALSRVQLRNRKGKTALDALLLKVTTMDSLQLFCLNSGLLNNDVVSCYDRMIPALTSIHLQGLGLLPKVAECSVLINQNMKHHIQTNAVESVEFYQHSNEYMKGGEGQGKTSFPPNLLFTSSTLLNSLEEQCTG
eukprot:7227179-Ditylum_brightwellii.AAC.1